MQEKIPRERIGFNPMMVLKVESVEGDLIRGRLNSGRDVSVRLADKKGKPVDVGEYWNFKTDRLISMKFDQAVSRFKEENEVEIDEFKIDILSKIKAKNPGIDRKEALSMAKEKVDEVVRKRVMEEMRKSYSIDGAVVRVGAVYDREKDEWVSKSVIRNGDGFDIKGGIYFLSTSANAIPIEIGQYIGHDGNAYETMIVSPILASEKHYDTLFQVYENTAIAAMNGGAGAPKKPIRPFVRVVSDFGSLPGDVREAVKAINSKEMDDAKTLIEAFSVVRDHAKANPLDIRVSCSPWDYYVDYNELAKSVASALSRTVLVKYDVDQNIVANELASKSLGGRIIGTMNLSPDAVGIFKNNVGQSLIPDEKIIAAIANAHDEAGLKINFGKPDAGNDGPGRS